MSDATLTDDQPETEAALPLETAADPAYDGPSCVKCGLATNAAACPRCGWYPSLGIHVEIDEAFEAVMQGAAAAETDGDTPAEPPKPEWQKHLEVWRDLIPGWGWLMIGVTLGAIGLGVGARIATLNSPTLQTYCGVGGLIAGLAIAVVAHVVAFLICSFDDADFGVVDVLIKPLKSWKKVLGDLPERLWLALSGNLGVSVALSAALIVGGIPYDRLLDWGFKAKAKKSLVTMIAEQAGKHQGDGADNLEDAVSDFAGQAGGVGGDAAKEPPAAKPRKKLECLILGYQVDSEGRLRGLLLAADQVGKLKYAGRVKPTLTADESRELLARFANNGSTRPLVKTADTGAWLRPKFMCRVSYTEWEPGKRPQDLEWDALLDDVQLPW